MSGRTVMNYKGIYPCQVCGNDFDGEYFEFNKEKNKDVYKCYACNGFNYFSPVEDDTDESTTYTIYFTPDK